MRKLSILLLLAAASVLHAQTYSYLTFTKSNGTTVSLNASSLELTVADGALKAVTNSGNTQFTLSSLAKMNFTTTPVVGIPSSGWATFCADCACSLTGTGLTAYGAQFGTDGSVTLTPVSGTIPAKTGVLLRGSEGTYVLTVTQGGTAPAGNELAGTLTDVTTTSAYAYYALADIDSQTVGFRRVATGVYVPTGKAYYRTSATASARDFYILGDDVTAVSRLSADGVEQSAPVYDLQGRRVASLQRGLYVRDGKKVVVR